MDGFDLMINHAKNFPKYLKDSFEKTKELETSYDNVEKVVIFGMGGSALPGILVEKFFFDEIRVPIIVNNDRFPPKFISYDTLAIFISYSGNTEETVNCLKEVIDKTSKIFVITSNGELLELAKRYNIPYHLVPKNIPPRMALPYLLTPLIKILVNCNLIDKKYYLYLSNISDLIQNKIPYIEDKGRSLAIEIVKSGSIPVIYAYRKYFAAAYKWKTDINENAKYYARAEEIPECCHNDICSWEKANGIPIFLRYYNEPREIKVRIECIKDVIRRYCNRIVELEFEDGLYGLLKSIVLGMFTSIYLAKILDVDPYEVKPIKELKEKLKILL